MTFRQIYLRSGIISLGGKLINAAAALAVVWFLIGITGKETFGEIMIAYTFNFILAAALASQFQAIILYHVSRNQDAHENKLGASLFYALAIGLILIVLENLIAQPFANIISKPGLAPWLSSLSWMVPAFALNSIQASWYRARQDIATMTMYFEVWPQLFRLCLLAAIFFYKLDPTLVSSAYVFSYLMSFIILYIQKPIPLRISPSHFTRWDMKYSLQMMISQLMAKSIGNITVFLIGVFSPAVAVADFTLASRFAQLLSMPKLIMTQIQMPRMGQQIENKQSATMLREFNNVRSLCLAGTIIGTAFLALLLPYILPTFGDFDGSYPLFLVLSLSFIIMAGFGSTGNYLGIAGHARANLAINGLSFLTLLGCVPLLVSAYGGMGGALATLISSLVLMIGMTYIIYQKDRLNTLNLFALIQMTVSAAIISAAILEIITIPATALSLILLAGSGLLELRPLLRSPDPS